MVKYRGFNNTVIPYEVLKETVSKITYIAKGGYETLELKETSSNVWGDTFEDCVNKMIKREEIKIAELYIQLSAVEDRMEVLKNLKNENQL